MSEEKASEKIQLLFKVNDQVIPVQGKVRYKWNGDKNITIFFSCGTTKVDNIELQITPIEYKEPINEQTSNI